MDTSPDRSSIPILLKVAPARLPGSFQALLDPCQPLPRQVRLFQRKPDVFFAALMAALVGGCTGIPGLLGIGEVLGKVLHGEARSWHRDDMVLYLGILAVMTVLAGIGFRLCLNLVAAIRDSRAQKEGRLRQGLFLCEDAVLLRLKPDCCSLLPRAALQEVDSRVVQSASHHYWVIQIHYQDSHEEARILEFPASEMEGKPSEITGQIRDWMANRPATASIRD